MRLICTVLFDYGGTLTTLDVSAETLVKECLFNIRTLLQKRGIKVSMEQLKKADAEAWAATHVPMSLRETNATVFFSELLKNLKDDISISDALIQEVARADYMTAVKYIKLSPDILLVLKVLQNKGYRMGVVSNNAFPETLETSIKRLKLEEFLDAIVSSGRIGYKKPATDIFEAALQELNTTADETVFVGDGLVEDVEGPKKLGITTIWINPSGKPSIPGIVPDFEIKKLSELIPVLDRI